MKTKNILVYSKKPDLHNLYSVFQENPPKGYKIILPKIPKTKTYSFLSKIKLAKFIYRKLTRLKNQVIKEALATKYDKIPENIELIFSPAKIILRQNPPHIIEVVDKITSLAGNDKKLFYKSKQFIKKALQQKSCKKVICWTKACKQDFIKEFKSPEINKKLEVVYLTKPLFPKKPVKKDYTKKQLNLLFVGSINNPDDFLIKGGIETLETFRVLHKKYPYLHLFIKCKVPKNIRKKYQHLPNLHIIENIIPREQLLKLYKEADIFMTPSHNLNAFAPIEAMAYSLPLVGINTWAVSEVILNNVNGFLVEKSQKIPYIKAKLHLDIRNKNFLKQIQKPDLSLIKRLAEKTELLIKDPKLRKKLGQNSRKLVEIGKFSFSVRQKKLKKIFNQAI